MRLKGLFGTVSDKIDPCGLAVLTVLFLAGMVDSLGWISGTSVGAIAGISCVAVVMYALYKDSKDSTSN